MIVVVEMVFFFGVEGGLGILDLVVVVGNFGIVLLWVYGVNVMVVWFIDCWWL